MEYGLTDNGFVVKPLEVILDEEQQAFKVAFGDDIDLSAQSVAGAYLYNQSIKISQIWELLGGLYTTGDVNSATGVYLDRLANFVGVTRKEATKTTVFPTLWGKVNTSIPKGHLTKDSNENIFELRNALQLNDLEVSGIELKIKTDSVGSDFEFDIAESEISYTAVSGDDKESIRNKLIELIEDEFPNEFVFDTSKNDILKFWHNEGIPNAFVLISDDTLEIKTVGNEAIYDAKVAGAIYVGVGQLNQIVNTISGLNQVINYSQGETGTDTESDDDFRIAIKTRQKNASGNEVAISNAVSKLEDVEYVRVYSNRTMSPIGTRPPKSFEVVVEGGDDEEIAETIFNTAPAGVQPYGTTEVTVKDDEGFNWQIGFSRPVKKYVWIKVKYTLNNEETPSFDIPQGIKDNLINWSIENLNIGLDLIYQKLYRPIYDVDGIASAEIKLAMTDDLNPPEDEDYASENLIIGDTELALMDLSRIDVQLED